ncbi:MAG: 1-acyl-sn-glycerol-3-phosphate acyltransferase [Clostridiales bacterium]|nr:1-acyl-sn-glycerol-3-phosphate acyltransferase [Clostridiales bacterium]
MADKSYNASRLFNKLLRPLAGIYLKHVFDLKFETDDIKALEPPFVVVANHTNFWDPFILSLCFREPVHFVTSDAYFRTPLLRGLLKLVGAIPKSKFVTDTNTVRGILKVVHNKGIICIFPEGRRNWDGTTLPLLHPPAKLIKKLALPVVSILFEGAHLAMPRWASKARKGPIIVHCSVSLHKEDILGMNDEDIYRSLSQSLAHDEYDCQRVAMRPYKSDVPAEKLELFLFTCPACRNMASMTSKADIFYCKSCSYSVKYDKYGFFKKTKDNVELYFDNPRDWNVWQLELLAGIIKDGNDKFTAVPLFEENSVACQTGDRTNPMENFASGRLSFYSDRLEFLNSEEIIASFRINEIYGANIQANNILEFYYDKTLYRFTGITRSLSAYKLVKSMDVLRQQ